jgi:hypothetical protein
MKIGNVVTWSWFLGTDWERTQMHGLIVAARVAKTDYEKVLIWNVLLTDGSLCEVREDEDGLELVA